MLDLDVRLPNRTIFATRVSILLVALAFRSFAASQSPLPRTSLSAERIRSLPLATVASDRIAVQLEGVLTHANHPWRTFILQDASSAIAFWGEHLPADLLGGERVRIQGVVVRGSYAPQVLVTNLLRLGKSSLPSARQVPIDRIFSGAEDAQRVELSGVVCQTVVTAGSIRWELLVAGRPIDVLFSGPIIDRLTEDRWIGTRVRVKGVCASLHNERGQFVAPRLLVDRADEIEVLSPAPPDPFQASITPLGRVLEFDPSRSASSRIHVNGIVTCTESPGSFHIQDASHGIRVTLAEGPLPALGSSVDVVGFPSPGLPAPEILHARIRTTPGGGMPPPEQVSMANLGPAQEGRLVTVVGYLAETFHTRGARDFRFGDSRGREFLARFARVPEAENDRQLDEGSELRLTGVYSHTSPPGTASTRPTLLLRDWDDVAVIQPGRWWNMERATLTALLLAIIVLGGVTWSTTLRRRLEAQRRLLEDQLAHRLSLERRHRELTEGAPDAIYTVDTHGRIVSANPAAATLTGRTEAELRTLSVFELVAPEEIDRVRDRIRNRFGSDGVDAPFEVDIVTRQGQRRRVEVTSRVLRLPDAALLLEGVARDITERRRAQEALEALLATTAFAGGTELFQIVVRRLAEVLRVPCAFIGVADEGTSGQVRTLAVWHDGQPAENFVYPLEGSPCGTVLGKGMCIYAKGVRTTFPSDARLARFQAEAFVGLPLWDSEGRPVGLLGLSSQVPFEPDSSQIDMLRILAARTGAEIDRLRATRALEESEKRFRELAEQTRDILWTADLTTRRIAYLSPSFSRICSPPVELVRRNPRLLLRLIPREDRTRVLAALRNALVEPSGRYATEYRIRRADGTLGWILDEGVVIRNSEGRPHRISGVARDITTRKEAELALAAERARFRDLFENSPDAIFLESHEGVVLDVNRAACQLHDLSREELTGLHIRELVPLVHREEVLAGFDRLRRGDLSRIDGWSLKRDGTEIPVELHVSQFRHEGNVALLVHARDLTFRRDAQELLDGQKRILEWIATGRPVEPVLGEILAVTQARWRHARIGIHWLPSVNDPRLRFVSPSSGPGTSVLMDDLGRTDGPIALAIQEAALRSKTTPAATAGREIVRLHVGTPSGSRTVLVEPMLESDGRPLGAVTAVIGDTYEPTPENLDILRLAASLGGVALHRHRADASLRDGTNRLRVANSALLSLASSDSVAKGDLGRALPEITEAAARGLGVARTNVWMLDEDGSTLRCLYAHGDPSDSGSNPVSFRASEFPRYFEALGRERFVSTAKVENDPRTSELLAPYLAPRGITSTLDAGIRLGGRLVGVLCHEHQGPSRTWTNEEELFAASLADLIAQTLQASQRRVMEEALRQSEEAYRSVVSVLAEGVMLVDRAGTFVTFNESAALILGCTSEFLRNHRLYDVPWETIRADGSPLPTEDYPVALTFRTGQPVSDSVMGVRRLDGNWVWLSINTRPFDRGEDGAIESVLVSFADITSRYAAERELRLNHDLLRAITQVQARFIADADPSRNLGHMLTALAEMTRSDSGIIGEVSQGPDGRSAFLLCAAMDVPPADGSPKPWPDRPASGSGNITALMEEVLRTQSPVVRSEPTPPPTAPPAALQTDVKPPTVHLLALPLRLDEKVLGVAGLARGSEAYDASAVRKLDPLLLTCASLFEAIRTARRRQEAEARIRELNADLERRVEERTADLRATNEELAEFAYVVTHDLKAPLRGIHQLAEWLTHDHAFGLDENGLKLLALLRRRVLHLQRLVDGLLACARVGRSPEPETTVSVTQLVHDVIGVLAPPPQVIVDVPEDLPSIQGNPERLHQVFQNLLDNAVKYLDKPEGFVRIRAARKPGAWEFRVVDNGPGIPARYREKVFQIFQRLDTRGDIPGTGLGLTLVRRIIEARGGRAWIESDDGKGTAVCFTWLDRAKRRPE